MIKFRKLIAASLCCMMFAGTMTGCGESGGAKGKDTSSMDGIVNFTAPEEGEDVLVLTVKDYGDIKIKLFPYEAEKGVENIKGLCEKNYYDGLIFHRIINNFMIQGGDPLGNGTGGECIWGSKFEGGTSDKLVHAAGAVAYANSGSTSTNGSQFYIVTGSKLTEADIEAYEAQGYPIAEDAKKIYMEDGGASWLDGGYTVFGQVYDGLDKVFEIQNVETGENDKPVQDVVIEKMRIEKYDGGDVKFHLSDYK